MALVESEVADVFALRLKLRGPIKPLVAYQMRPNPDIPKDRNLVSFKINPTYTKQSCPDGRLGLEADASYPMAGQDGPPRDVSYFKPGEAYALKDRIRRAEEQLAGEHERYDLSRINYAVSSLASSFDKGKLGWKDCEEYVGLQAVAAEDYATSQDIDEGSALPQYLYTGDEDYSQVSPSVIIVETSISFAASSTSSFSIQSQTRPKRNRASHNPPSNPQPHKKHAS